MDRSLVAGVPCFAQGLAACLKGKKCSEVIVSRPARQIRPLDRLKLAARKFQRLLG